MIEIDNENTKNNNENIKNNQEFIAFTELLYKDFCYVKNDNNIYINYKSFKRISSFFKHSNNHYIINYLIKVINNVLNKYELFNIYANLGSLTLLDIDKNKEFIKNISVILKQQFPDKLDKCFICNAPFIFTQLFNMISFLIDKKTQKKIVLIENDEK